MTRTIYINFLSPFPRRLHINLALIGQAVLEKKIFENGGHIYVYSPEADAEFSPGVQSFHLHIYSVNLVLRCKFSQLNDFVTVSPIQMNRQPNLTLL